MKPNLKVETLRLELEPEGFFLPGKLGSSRGGFVVFCQRSLQKCYDSMAPPLFSSLSKCVSGKKEEAYVAFVVVSCVSLIGLMQ